MNEVATTTTQLPDTLEDLTQFVLVGKAKLNAYMLKLQTVNRLSVAQEIRDQTLKEAQEISTALIAAEQRIGELLLAIPVQSGRRSDIETSAERTAKVKTKAETISDMGYDRHEASDYQQMAKNPEIVQKVIEDAIANGEVVTKTAVMKEIKAAKDEVKREMQDLREERDYFESQIEERDAKISELLGEVVNPKTITVYPDDYEELKRKNESHMSDYRTLEKSRKAVIEENRELKQRIKDLETREGIDELQAKLEQEASYFTIRTYDYIQKNGGYVWITEKIEQLPEKQRKEFIATIYAIDAFAKQMIENIGGYGIE